MIARVNYLCVSALYLTLPLIAVTVCQTFRCDSFCYDNPADDECEPENEVRGRGS